MKNNATGLQTPMARLAKFVRWAIVNGLCKTESEFERQCSLTSKYIHNNSGNAKGNIGTEIMGRIANVYPQLNLRWLCTGEGYMLAQVDEVCSAEYRRAYEASKIEADALNRIISVQSAHLS